jgi:hypothetical protein
MGGNIELTLIPFNARAEDRLYSNAGYPRGANDHVLAWVYLRNRDIDKFFGGCIGHELFAVPLLEVLNGGKAHFFFMSAIESDMNNVFAGSSRHFTSWILE